MKKSVAVRRASNKTLIAKPQAQGPMAWSYSRLQVYRECPRKFYYKFIERLIEPQGDAASRGQEVHELFEHYARGGGVEFKEKVHTDCLKWLEHTRELKPIIEEGFAFDQSWQRTEYFAKNVACRVKMDLFYQVSRPPKKAPHKYTGKLPIAISLDYKTGKIDPEKHAEQLKLYALSGLLILPEVSAVQTGVWYVDHEAKPRFMAEFGRSQLTMLKRYWEGETKRLFKDRVYRATPSTTCSWCYASCHKGGPCKDSAAKK